MPRPRSSKAALARLLDQAGFPVYLVDPQRQIVYANPALARWVEAELDAVIGQQCDYHSTVAQPGSAADFHGLCPPPRAFAGQRLETTIAWRMADGSVRQRQASCVPLEIETARTAVLVLADDRPGGSGRRQDEAADLHRQIWQLRDAFRLRFALDQLLGESVAMQQVRQQIELAIQGTPRVVVVGPPGSGREQVARTLYYNRRGSATPSLVPLSCPLLDAELLRSTIEAYLQRCAELEDDESGTLLLLEVDQLPADGQAALAEFLTIAQLPLHTLATARQPLGERVAAGQFRHDLACILSTLSIQLPALADRPEDIPLLAQLAVEQANAREDPQREGFTLDALDHLQAYHWPGNVDELFELVTQAHRAATGPQIGVADLPARLTRVAEARAHPPRQPASVPLDPFLQQVEREALQRALTAAKGNKAQAARLLGISRARLLRRLDQLGLNEH